MVDSNVRITGALAPHGEGLWAVLLQRGYTPLSARNLMRLAAHLSRWLDEQSRPLESLTPDSITAFCKARRQAGYSGFRSPRALAPILCYLEQAGIARSTDPKPQLSGLDQLMQRYAASLCRERGITEGLAALYCDLAQQFLTSCLTDDLGPDLRMTLQARDVTSFLLKLVPHYATGTVALVASRLRVLLRFLLIEGYLDVDLTGAIPAVAHPRNMGVPKFLEADEVRRLLRTCDRRRHVGRRNFAVLKLLVRLGLRRGEVAALELDDIDWHNGDFRVRGKGNRHERLPMPIDVGTALANYLRWSRPHTTDRHVFLGVRAPFAVLPSGGIGAIARSALARAGLSGSSHRLRHTAATQMLRAGASLDEVAQVLRHRSHTTTAIYAKVDRGVLSSVARPWPGAAS